MPGDGLQYRFENNTEITKAGPVLTTHNSVYAEPGSVFRQKFILQYYQTTDDITGVMPSETIDINIA